MEIAELITEVAAAARPGDMIQFFTGPNGIFISIERKDEFVSFFDGEGHSTQTLPVDSALNTIDDCENVAQLIAAQHGLTARLIGNINGRDHWFLLEVRKKEVDACEESYKEKNEPFFFSGARGLS